jgi:hypothetical protein
MNPSSDLLGRAASHNPTPKSSHVKVDSENLSEVRPFARPKKIRAFAARSQPTPAKSRTPEYDKAARYPVDLPRQFYASFDTNVFDRLFRQAKMIGNLFIG